MGFGAVPGETGSFLRPSGFWPGGKSRPVVLRFHPCRKNLRQGCFPFPVACVPGVFRSRQLVFPVFSFAAFPLRMFYFPPACRTARFVLWPGAGTKKPPGNRRLSLSWSRGGLVPENLLLCHGLDRAEGLEVVQVEILNVAQNAVDVFASFHPLFLCGLDIG